MEITPEQIEKVRSCTGATYEQARAALEETGGNVLDAVILLERRGRSAPAGGDYSTRTGGPDGAGEEPAGERPTAGQVWQAIKWVAAHCLSISLEIWKDGRMTCMIPLIVGLVLVLLEPGTMCLLWLAGLCFGYRVHITGRGTEDWSRRFNRVMDQLSDTVSDAVADLGRDRRKRNGK